MLCALELLRTFWLWLQRSAWRCSTAAFINGCAPWYSGITCKALQIFLWSQTGAEFQAWPDCLTAYKCKWVLSAATMRIEDHIICVTGRKISYCTIGLFVSEFFCLCNRKLLLKKLYYCQTSRLHFYQTWHFRWLSHQKMWFMYCIHCIHCIKIQFEVTLERIIFRALILQFARSIHPRFRT